MSSPQQVLNCRYRYDPLDRLTSQTQADTPPRQRFYCKSRLATEIQGTIGHSIVQHDDLLLAQHQRQNGVLNSTLLATDLQRSVLQMVMDNHQRQPIAYSPYGHRPAESGLSSLLGFNGERPDPVTGHYLLGNGYRAYNPVLMRFNIPDSWSPFGKGGLNPYTYSLGDPVNMIDPNGRSPILYLMSKASRITSYPTTTIAPIYKSGFSKTRHSITTTITYTSTSKRKVHANGNWIEISKINGIQVRHEEGHFGYIIRQERANPVTVTKIFPTLQELSYSKIKGSDMLNTKSFPHGLSKNINPMEVDKFNLNNRILEHFHKKKQTTPEALDFDLKSEATREAIVDAKNGHINGVHPNRVSYIVENSDAIRKHL